MTVPEQTGGDSSPSQSTQRQESGLMIFFRISVIGAVAFVGADSWFSSTAQQAYRVKAVCETGQPALSTPRIKRNGRIAGSTGTSKLTCPDVSDGAVKSAVITEDLTAYDPSSPLEFKVKRDSMTLGLLTGFDAEISSNEDGNPVVVVRGVDHMTTED